MAGSAPPQPATPGDEALTRFLRRVWQQDVEPLLRGERAAQRRRAAGVGGKVAATGGLLIDSLLGLRGRPFTRALTVLGTSFGAMLPDVWDWKWFQAASPQEQATARSQIRRRAAELPEADALALFGLSSSASRAELKSAWHGVCLRWHPDRAPDAAQRREYHTRFIVYQAAYARLVGAYEAGRLPVAGSDSERTDTGRCADSTRKSP